ncbi:MAG: IS200/IS605 family transposase [Candidatus Micrarchaeota archaeon]
MTDSVSGSFAHASHAVDDVVYKVEWCTKYRYKMFGKEEFFKACEEAIRDVCARHKIIVVELAVMPEHVHCIVRAFARYSLAYVTQLLKGGSSYILFRRFPKMRLRYPRGHLWSAGKARRTLGVDLQVARDYVRAPHNDPFQTRLA